MGLAAGLDRDARVDDVGVVGGLVGIVIAAIMALYVLSAPKAIGRIVDGVTKFPAALSHIVIGVGFLIAQSAAMVDTASTFAGLVVLAVVGAAINGGLKRLERHVLRWRAG